LLPDIANTLELLGKSPAAATAVNLGDLVVLAARPDGQTKREAAARNRVQGRRLLGEQRGVSQRRDHDHGREPHPARDRRGRRQRREGLVILVGNAVEATEAGERPRVGTLRPLDQDVTADAGRRRRKAEPDVHYRRSFGGDDKFSRMSAFRGSAAPTQSWNHFRFTVEDGVATISFDRPQKLNGLTFQVYGDLGDLLTDLPLREDVRVLVITGTGRGFSSGGDVNEIIGELQKMDARDLLAFTRMTGTVTQRMRDCPLPIIASVNGVAAGAGAVIALAADLRILARSATFSFLFTKVGLSGGDMGSAYLLPRLIGLGRATELLLLGEQVTADRALAIGLANAVLEDSELGTGTTEVARRLAQGPALAYAATKMLIAKQLDMNLGAALELDSMTQALLMKSADHAEFYAAFREGREAKWSGREPPRTRSAARIPSRLPRVSPTRSWHRPAARYT